MKKPVFQRPVNTRGQGFDPPYLHQNVEIATVTERSRCYFFMSFSDIATLSPLGFSKRSFKRLDADINS